MTKRSIVLGLVLGLLTIAMFGCAYPKYGSQGEKGNTGADGSSCSTYPATDGSGALIKCTNGSSAFISNGATGQTGATGATGANGQNGVNATPVEMIQLCPSIVGGYGNFPEFAFKINGKLYGTYSGSGVAFSTQLYPGNWVSTTTNSGNNCSFTVNSDYTVTN